MSNSYIKKTHEPSPHDASEDVDQDGLHLLVSVEQLESLLYLALGGSTADVQEVGRVTALKLQFVEVGKWQVRHQQQQEDRVIKRKKEGKSKKKLIFITLMMSMVAMARPAPLTMQPMLPVRPM